MSDNWAKIYTIWGVRNDITNKGLMKMSSERLKNVPYFWNKKNQIVLSFFIIYQFRSTLIYLTVDDDTLLKILRCLKWKKTSLGFLILKKWGKFWSISVVNFIKHEPLISEEWSCIMMSYSAAITRNVTYTRPREVWYFNFFLCLENIINLLYHTSKYM